MPMCETSTSTWTAAGSRHDSQLTTSSLRENSETNWTSSGNGATTAARVRAQQSPRRQLKLNIPGTPSDPSVPTVMIVGQIRGLTDS